MRGQLDQQEDERATVELSSVPVRLCVCAG